MISVLKCFVTPTITYTAQVDEGVLHINFDTHHIIEYICWTCFVSTASDTCFNMLCYADFNILRSSRRKYVAYLFESRQIIEYICWNWIAKTACDSRFKMLCYADFNIHRSSRRKCVAYLFWNEPHYWVYVLKLICMDC